MEVQLCLCEDNVVYIEKLNKETTTHYNKMSLASLQDIRSTYKIVVFLFTSYKLAEINIKNNTVNNSIKKNKYCRRKDQYTGIYGIYVLPTNNWTFILTKNIISNHYQDKEILKDKYNKKCESPLH